MCTPPSSSSGRLWLSATIRCFDRLKIIHITKLVMHCHVVARRGVVGLIGSACEWFARADSCPVCLVLQEIDNVVHIVVSRSKEMYNEVEKVVFKKAPGKAPGKTE